jgi:hypothetical protein
MASTLRLLVQRRSCAAIQSDLRRSVRAVIRVQTLPPEVHDDFSEPMSVWRGTRLRGVVGCDGELMGGGACRGSRSIDDATWGSRRPPTVQLARACRSTKFLRDFPKPAAVALKRSEPSLARRSRDHRPTRASGVRAVRAQQRRPPSAICESTEADPFPNSISPLPVRSYELAISPAPIAFSPDSATFLRLVVGSEPLHADSRA